MFFNQLPAPSPTPDIPRPLTPPLTWSANHAMTETPKPGLTLRPLVVAILPGHSFQATTHPSVLPAALKATWLIKTNHL